MTTQHEAAERVSENELVIAKQAWSDARPDISGTHDNALRAAINAVLALRAHDAGQAGVAVKPLEWGRSVMPPFIASARTPVGSYRVNHRGQNGWWWMFSGILGDEGYGREDEAKAAAQADYERRILSTLESPDLIAAAPTMLEALKDAEAKDEALHGFDDLQCFANDPETHQEYEVEYRRRRTQRLAIALAEGRTPGETP